ncbi:MAG TPA: topoisomerase DNA-binding C4 zinc finger domain-containing protein, partial [Candidatus Izemoplasmatales bacterium]|nr:topoisomerase DNA-binding C4 zinc finger domain-containing protein [Candidatus Izemoplasmatales bacterium]
QSPMVFRQSRYGNFEACSNFPKCRYVKPTPNGKPSAVPARDTGAICPQCHKGHLVERVASKGKNKGNMFFACNNFPKCKYIAPFHTEGEPCPEGRMAIQTGDGKTACIEKTSHETHK